LTPTKPLAPESDKKKDHLDKGKKKKKDKHRKGNTPKIITLTTINPVGSTKPTVKTTFDPAFASDE
jgi:hypothetical protein